MRRESLIDDALHHDPEEPLAHAPVAAGARMREERGDGLPEDALVEEVDFPPAALFRRRTDELDPDLEILRVRGGGEERADDRHRDQVVTAAVPNVGQRVVLGEQGNGRTRRADARAERGREAAEIALDLVTVLLEEGGDAADGAVLRVGELGIGVDLARKPDQVLAERIFHFVICSRRLLSMATRTAAAPSTSAVISALRCARSLRLASRISTEWPGTGFSLTGKRTQSVGTFVETLPRSVDAVTRTPRSAVTPWRCSSAARTSPSARFAFTGS